MADSGAVPFITAAERGLSTGSSAAFAADIRKRPKGASLEFGKWPAFGRHENSTRIATTAPFTESPPLQTGRVRRDCAWRSPPVGRFLDLAGRFRLDFLVGPAASLIEA